jgi:hypothetical protein
MFVPDRPLYDAMLLPAKWVQESYWDKIEDIRGARIGEHSSRKMDLKIRVLSIANAIFQGLYAFFATIPVVSAASFSLVRNHGGHLSVSYVVHTLELAIMSIWSPMVSAVTVCIDPSVLEEEDRRVQVFPNRLKSQLWFQVNPH